MAQLSLPSLYPASIMHHPLKKKGGKQFKTRPLQRNSSHMENCSSRGAAASPAAMERPIRAGKSSQGSAQVGGLLLFWGEARSSRCSAQCEGLQVPPVGKGLLKTGKTFLKDASPVLFGHPEAGLCTHSTHHCCQEQCIFHTFPFFLAAPSAGCCILTPGVEGPTDPPVPSIHLAGPSQCSLPEGFFTVSVPFCSLL